MQASSSTAAPVGTREQPLYGVCTWQTPRNTIFEDIEQTARTGGQGVGLWEAKFDDGADDDIRASLAQHGLKPTLCVPRLHTLLVSQISAPGSPTDPKERTRLILASVERLAAFDPVAIIVGPGTSADPTRPHGPLDVIAEGLAIVADRAAELGQRIAFEALAARHGAPVARLNEIVPFLDDLGRDNVGVLFDVFHSWEEPGLHDHIRLYVDRIAGVHVNDVLAYERSWCDRAFPGDGRGVCPDILATFIEAGYRGWYESEVFSDDGRFGNTFPDSLWRMPHEEFLQRNQESFDRCYTKALAIADSRAAAPV